MVPAEWGHAFFWRLQSCINFLGPLYPHFRCAPQYGLPESGKWGDPDCCQAVGCTPSPPGSVNVSLRLFLRERQTVGQDKAPCPSPKCPHTWPAPASRSLSAAEGGSRAAERPLPRCGLRSVCGTHSPMNSDVSHQPNAAPGSWSKWVKSE